MHEIQHFGVPYQIGRNIMEFGIFLLQDYDGIHMEKIRRHFFIRGFKATYPILKMWLAGEGRPVTWKSLIEALRYCGNNTLADEIQAIKGKLYLNSAVTKYSLYSR